MNFIRKRTPILASFFFKVGMDEDIQARLYIGLQSTSLTGALALRIEQFFAEIVIEDFENFRICSCIGIILLELM